MLTQIETSSLTLEKIDNYDLSSGKLPGIKRWKGSILSTLSDLSYQILDSYLDAIPPRDLLYVICHDPETRRGFMMNPVIYGMIKSHLLRKAPRLFKYVDVPRAAFKVPFNMSLQEAFKCEKNDIPTISFGFKELTCNSKEYEHSLHDDRDEYLLNKGHIVERYWTFCRASTYETETDVMANRAEASVRVTVNYFDSTIKGEFVGIKMDDWDYYVRFSGQLARPDYEEPFWGVLKQ